MSGGFLEYMWSRFKFSRAEIKELYLPGDSGTMKKITATADEINALSPISAPPDGSVTNAKMANDVKIGSLASLTTTVKTSIQAAINEIVANIGALSGLSTTAKNTVVAAINEVDAGYKAKYTRPSEGIPAGDLAASVQNTLCGIPQNEVSYGAIGLGESEDWEDTNFQVLLTYKGTGAAAKDLGWNTPTTSGFNVTCETTSDTGYVSVLVVG